MSAIDNLNDSKDVESQKFLPKVKKVEVFTANYVNERKDSPEAAEKPKQRKWEQQSDEDSRGKLVIGLAILFLFIVIVLLFLFLRFYPTCNDQAKRVLPWFKTEVIYQVEVSNFKDSDGDAIGDIKGLIQKLDYINELSAKTICLSRVISKASLKQIDPQYGDDSAMKELREQLNQRGMYLILDIPFNYFDESNNDEDTVQFWLKDYADGIRVTNVNNNNQIYSDVKIQKLTNLVNQLSTKDKPKYFGVQSITETNSFLELNPLVLGVPSRISGFLSALYKDESAWPVLQLGEVNSKRIKGLFENSQMFQLAHGMVLLLKGTPFVLFGDEIELKGGNEIENTMQWDTSSMGCGFTDNQDVGHFFKDSTSCLNAGQFKLRTMYKNLTALRQEPAFKNGAIRLIENQSIISFVREFKEANFTQRYLVMVNPIDREVTVELKNELPLSNSNCINTVTYSFSTFDNKHEIRSEVDLSKRVTVFGGELLVLKLEHD